MTVQLLARFEFSAMYSFLALSSNTLECMWHLWTAEQLAGRHFSLGSTAFFSTGNDDEFAVSVFSAEPRARPQGVLSEASLPVVFQPGTIHVRGGYECEAYDDFSVNESFSRIAYFALPHNEIAIYLFR